MQQTKNIINISYACNNNYVLPLCTSIKSVLANLSSDYILKVYVICSDTLNEQCKQLIKQISTKNCQINFVSVKAELFERFYLGENQHITRETYYRYLLPDLLPNLDKILYLDCDTIALNDISEILQTDLNGFYIAGVKDFSELEFKKRLSLNQYCNAGVLFFNLKKIRQENMSQKLIQYTIEHYDTIPFQDQDVINIVFQKGIKILDNKWNTQLAYFSEYTNYMDNYLYNNGKILHYICEVKPWQRKYNSLYKLHFFKYFYMLPNEIQFLLLDFKD